MGNCLITQKGGQELPTSATTLATNYGTIKTTKAYRLVYATMTISNSSTNGTFTTSIAKNGGTAAINQQYQNGHGSTRFIIFVNVPSGTTITTSETHSIAYTERNCAIFAIE